MIHAAGDECWYCVHHKVVIKAFCLAFPSRNTVRSQLGKHITVRLLTFPILKMDDELGLEEYQEGFFIH